MMDAIWGYVLYGAICAFGILALRAIYADRKSMTPKERERKDYDMQQW